MRKQCSSQRSKNPLDLSVGSVKANDSGNRVATVGIALRVDGVSQLRVHIFVIGNRCIG